MRIAIITASMSPFHCGIGDHSSQLAGSLRQLGHEVSIIAGRGEACDGVSIIDSNWEVDSLERLFRRLTEMHLELVIIQFTPLMYHSANDRDGRNMVLFLKRCAKLWKTAVIVHETYFRTWRYLPSLIRGTREKALLQGMVRHSHYIFSASQPLVNEMSGWGSEAKISLLPIGSNFRIVEVDRDLARYERGVGKDDILLVMFGGGNNLKWMKRHVQRADLLLYSEGVKAKWLMLGGIPGAWFRLRLPVVSLGRVDEDEISVRLRTGDIFLMPHFSGLCAKRGTLMAAMQHSLPVVGTRSGMTDTFWDNVQGVCLIPVSSARNFAQQVANLACDSEARTRLGSSNQDYFRRHFNWEQVADMLLKEVSL